MKISRQDIENYEQRFRTTFVNSLAGFRQAVLVGSKSKSGHSNLAIFNSLIHVGANPALFGLISRPDTVLRDTLENIKETGVYSLNFVQASDFQKAHQTSARYGREVSEFEKVGFQEHFWDGFSAPTVQEAVVKIGMQLEEIIPIKLNGTLMIIGSVQKVELDDTLVQTDGFVALHESQVLIIQGLYAYFEAKFLGRQPYAKP